MNEEKLAQVLDFMHGQIAADAREKEARMIEPKRLSENQLRSVFLDLETSYNWTLVEPIRGHIAVLEADRQAAFDVADRALQELAQERTARQKVEENWGRALTGQFRVMYGHDPTEEDVRNLLAGEGHALEERKKLT